jgi:hypothetical protein
MLESIQDGTGILPLLMMWGCAVPDILITWSVIIEAINKLK